MHHILTGRISGSGDGLTLTLRLHARGEDQPVWTESFSGRTNELIALERRALVKIASALGLKITGTEQQKIDQLLTNNLEALNLMRQAWGVFQHKAGTQSGFKDVRELAQKAILLDSRYVDADFFDAYIIRNLFVDRAPSDVWPDVERRMLNIEQRDDTFGQALDQLGGYLLIYQRDWIGAYRLWNRGLLYCSEQERHFRQAFYYRIHGWFDEARIHQELSEQSKPAFIEIQLFSASSRWVERRYAEGAAVARKTLELYPGQALGYQLLAHCLVGNGEYEAGIQATHKAQEVWKKQEMTALRAVAYAKWGQPEKARETLQELLAVERTGPYLQPYYAARVYCALNEKAKALDWLEKADQDKSEYLFMGDFGGGLRTDPAWDDFQNEPRFQALLKKVGLDQWPRPKPKLEPGPDF